MDGCPSFLPSANPSSQVRRQLVEAAREALELVRELVRVPGGRVRKKILRARSRNKKSCLFFKEMCIHYYIFNVAE